MNDEIFYIMNWILGGLGTLLIFLFGIWWKIEARQDLKIDNIQICTARAHKELHDKIDSNHHAIRDRLDNIWKHINT